jgi:hypothetical protein
MVSRLLEFFESHGLEHHVEMEGLRQVNYGREVQYTLRLHF